MTKTRKAAVIFVALLSIAVAIGLILERDETGTVVLGASVLIGLMIYLIGFSLVPFQRMFTISNTKEGMVTIGSNSVKRLIHRAVYKKGIRRLEGKIKKVGPDVMEVWITAGISAAMSATEFSSEVQEEVKRVVEEGTGLEVSKVDVHVWHYKGKK